MADAAAPSASSGILLNAYVPPGGNVVNTWSVSSQTCQCDAAHTYFTWQKQDSAAVTSVFYVPLNTSVIRERSDVSSQATPGIVLTQYIQACWDPTGGVNANVCTGWNAWTITVGNAPTPTPIPTPTPVPTPTPNYGTSWQALSGAALDIAYGNDGSLWVIGNDQGIYYWNGSSFASVPGGGVRIAVDASGNPWIINSANQIYERVGGVNGTWLQRPGAGTDIGAGADGSVWVLGIYPISGTSNYPAYHWNGSSLGSDPARRRAHRGRFVR